ncbi:hypothetical protein BN874_1350017 [Candidatus Contendobacter odensis Run_B_J11]|uniref:Uncharacterized protein n=1 Tax=Candidatus Contendobacter odensis Run_B_J11 TaxID=1400861 RepID=A0A7U7G922_9GAMM|nr:hypothetical protein BN874_1350017 [Candidatus Contendobacter odensis Run_B_J11]
MLSLSEPFGNPGRSPAWIRQDRHPNHSRRVGDFLAHYKEAVSHDTRDHTMLEKIHYLDNPDTVHS